MAAITKAEVPAPHPRNRAHLCVMATPYEEIVCGHIGIPPDIDPETGLLEPFSTVFLLEHRVEVVESVHVGDLSSSPHVLAQAFLVFVCERPVSGGERARIVAEPLFRVELAVTAVIRHLVDVCTA